MADELTKMDKISTVRAILCCNCGLGLGVRQPHQSKSSRLDGKEGGGKDKVEIENAKTLERSAAGRPRLLLLPKDAFPYSLFPCDD